MNGLSEHTLLMNVIICLTRKSRDLPSSLFDQGYQLEYIGLKFTNRAGEEIHPDLSIKGHSESTLLLVDCKSGGLKHLQAQRYSKLTPEDIVSASVTRLDSKGLILDVTFAGTDKAGPKLLEAESRENYGLPIVIFDRFLLQKQGPGKFRNPNLESLFNQGVTFPKRCPTGFYPFSPDDSRAHILTEVASVLFEMHRKQCEFSEEEVLKEAHPFYDNFDDDERNQLKGRLGSILSEIPQEKDYRWVLTKQNHKWMIDPQMSTQRLQKAIQEYVELVDYRDKQTNLIEIFKRQST
jgi:hypothetical protein